MSSTITCLHMSSTVTMQEEMFLSTDLESIDKLERKSSQKPQELQIVWRNIFTFSLMHLSGLYGLYHLLFYAKWETLLWTVFLHYFGMMGITAGSHRLWSHRAFKAKTPTRIALMLGTTVAYQNGVIEWVRDHRCHHKWTDTDADPHNSKRGFFYSHVGWLLTRKLPQLKEMGAKIDLSDLYDDPVLVFQEKHFVPLVLIFCFLLPAAIPVYLWNENALVAYTVAVSFRYAFCLNATWLINSAAHMFGYKPYDVNISPVENKWTSTLAAGEGGHNFHHSFPQDYRTSEFGYMTNWTHALLDILAWMGQVYDMKIATEEMIKRQMEKKGEGALNRKSR